MRSLAPLAPFSKPQPLDPKPQALNPKPQWLPSEALSPKPYAPALSPKGYRVKLLEAAGNGGLHVVVLRHHLVQHLRQPNG